MYLADKKSWYLERVIFLIGGSVILLSMLLAWYFGLYWPWYSFWLVRACYKIIKGVDIMDLQLDHTAREYILRKVKDKAIIIETMELPGRS